MQNRTYGNGTITTIYACFLGGNYDANPLGKMTIKVNNVEYNSTEFSVGSETWTCKAWATNPNTGANWTWTEINNLIAGANIYASGLFTWFEEYRIYVDFIPIDNIIGTSASCTLPSANMDWNITTNMFCKDQTITIPQNRSINIMNFSRLSLQNVTIRFNMTMNGTSKLNNYGRMNFSNVTIDSTNASWKYLINIYTSFNNLTNSRIYNMGINDTLNYRGMWVLGGFNNISNNLFRNCTWNMELVGNSNTIRNNIIYGGEYGVSVHIASTPSGDYPYNPMYNLIINNTFYSVDTYSIALGQYSQYNNASYNMLNDTKDCGITISSTYNIVSFNSINYTHNEQILLFTGANYNTVFNNTINNGDTYGINIMSAQQNRIENNTILGQGQNDFLLSTGGTNTYCNNYVNNNTGYGGKKIFYSNETGLRLNGGTYSMIMLCNANNSIISNVTLSESNSTFYLYYSKNVTIMNSRISNAKTDGILMLNTGYSNVTNNTIYNSKNFGIRLQVSGTKRSNWIYNNIFNNTNNSKMTTSSYTNYWNVTETVQTNIVGGSNIGGNVWVYPNGTGFSYECTDADSDSICDTTYTTDASNIDMLPLYLSLGAPPESTCDTWTTTHEIKCSDNCVISSNVDNGGSNLNISGTGYVVLNANITNINTTFLIGNCYIFSMNGNGLRTGS
jgi:parallel beta-helix repeat protein